MADTLQSKPTKMYANHRLNSPSIHGHHIRKFLNKFPHPKSPTFSTTFSPHSDSKLTDISKCPVMASQHSLLVNFEGLSPTQRQIDLVRTSWERVSEIRHDSDDRNVSASHAFGLAFYEALFEIDPEARDLFANVFQQARALTGMISFIARAPNVTANNNSNNNYNNNYNGTTKSLAGGCTYAPPSNAPTTIRDINAAKKKRQDNNENETEEHDETDQEWLAFQMRELGAKHYHYKVKPHHFELVGPAFASALKKRLGNEYTTEIGEAWVKANSYVALNMKIGFETEQANAEGPPSGKSSKRNKAACVIQ